jgi:endogenous inhibitor of DNA gyrase (YacG/DUF329 family)
MSQAESSSVECPTCGSECASEHGVKIHHQRVHGESIAGVKIECAECGSTERIEPWKHERAERNFCSDECRRLAGRVSGVCHRCGDTFTRKESNFPDSDRHFCKPECRHEFIGGENHPRAGSNGETGRYNGSWQSTANRIRDRDGGLCQRCGIESGDRSHPVHHIVPIQRFEDWGEKYEFVDVEDSHIGRNLITLCSACHHDVDEDRSLCPAPPGSWRAE